jgi:hypothetical protein
MRNHLSGSLLALLTLQGCWWNAPPNDAGEQAFAAQAVRVVLGRHPRGAAEIRALAEISNQAGRQAVLDVLFEEPDYVNYWSNVLIDDLKLQRAGDAHRSTRSVLRIRCWSRSGPTSSSRT